MARIEWDRLEDRQFESGLDRGVLYLEDGSAVAWNGLISINEKSADAAEPYYIDGEKYLDMPSHDEFSAGLAAFTYPDEFSRFIGLREISPGLIVGGQQQKTFGLSWRTGVGDALSGLSKGFRIHIAYNLTANESDHSSRTTTESVVLDPMTWEIESVPVTVPGYYPTAHIILDTSILNRFLVRDLEAIIYGTPTTPPRLPTIDELRQVAVEFELFTVVDHGDGTFSITGPDELFRMINDTTWEISEINATYLDPNTYTASSTKS